MPQMSPLGWCWLIIFVSFGYFMFLAFFYFLSVWNFSFSEVSLGKYNFNWLW